MKNTTQTIDCTPTWSGILPVIVALIQNPNTRKDGIIELQRMAELADAYVAERKTNQKLPTMKKKTFITSVSINIEIQAENQEQADDQFFNATISIKDPEGKELDWMFINHETFEA